MNNNINDIVKYDKSKKIYTEDLQNIERRKVADTWINQSNSLDRWRHDRMYKKLSTVVNFFPDDSWLTIGDGRYGTDGNALMKLGAKKVHCSDMCDDLLKIGKEKKFIKEYSEQNAENLKFTDNHFDWLYCKESLHHMPRPYIALKEMFRVAKKGVFLTEPRDIINDRNKLSVLLTIIKKIFNKKQESHGFESAGNYLYTFSERDIEKFLLGIHVNIVAFKGINDAYIEGCEFVKMDTQNKNEIKMIKKLKHMITKQNLLDILSFRKSGVLSSILFKSKPPKEFLDKLKRNGWIVKILPKNPYL